MFLKYLEPVFRPWRAMRSKIVKVKTVRGNALAEGRRVQRFGNLARQNKKRLEVAHKDMGAGSPSNAGATGTLSRKGSTGYIQGMSAKSGEHSSATMKSNGRQVAIAGLDYPRHLPPMRIRGFFWKQKSCTQCRARLEMSWDYCPYCFQAFAPRPEAKPGHTQAIRLAQAREGRTFLGWVVSIVGVERGELFTLSTQNVIGKDPSCTIVLRDEYLSAHHVEIVLRDGLWLLRDLGSSNGTLVNDKPVTHHELVDSDFIGIGNSVIKFKCLEHG